MSQQIYSRSITPGTQFTVSVPYWGGVVEFINYSPYPCDINGGSGYTSLGPNQKVGLSGMPNGSSYSILPNNIQSSPGSISTTFQCNWYASTEMEPYPPTEISTPPSNPIAGNTQANIWVDTQIASSGGNIQYFSTAPQSIYLLGFDITGDKAASVSTGVVKIQNLANPLTGDIYNDLVYYVNQGTNGTTPIQERFPFTLRTVPGGTLNIVRPNMAATIYIVVFYQIY